jgi:glyoxylase-like metal-dependent hydrolase (beta-lactamase superfamily II)
MNSKQLTPTLTQLTQFHFVNAYLVQEDDGLTLVDTTMGKAVDGILAAAGGSLRRIALTHGHGDHVGDTVDLAKQHGATVGDT